MSMRPNALVAFCLAVFASVAAADVVHLRDGSRVEGKVRFCDEESCSIEKRRVPIANIARITLVPGKLIPSAARGGGIVLTDGAVLTGAFTGLTLGYVEVGGEEIDRENVAEIILVKMTEPAADTLIGTDGQSREGKLTACNAASCTFDGQTIPFDKIRWLGPGQENSVPPVAADANLVFVGEESPKEARLSGLNGTTVRTTRGSFARADVKWIRLATPPGAAAPGNTSPPPGQQPSTTDTPPPAGQPPPRQPRPGATPPTGYPGDQLIRNGRIWLGRIEGRVWDEREDNQEDLRISVDVRLREDTLRPIESDPPALKRVGDNIIFSEEGTVVRNTYRSSNSSETCTGGGETVLPAHPGLFTTTFYRRTKPGPMNSFFPFGLTIGRDPYVLAISPTKPTVTTYVITCLDSNGETRTRESSFTVPPAGRLYANSNSTDPEIRFLQGGRMMGSYERQRYSPSELVSLSWSVCVEGTACPPPRPLDPPTPENNEPLPPRDLPPDPDWCSQVTSLIAKLRAEQDAYNGHQAAVTNAQERIDLALEKIWGWEGALRKYFTSWLSIAAIGATPMLEKAIDLSVFLMNTEGTGSQEEMQDAMDALYETQDIVALAAQQTAVREATIAADAVLNGGGTDSEALQTYARKIQGSERIAGFAEKITKALDVAKAAKEHYADAKELGEQIYQHDEAKNDRRDRQAELDAASGRLVDIRFQLEEARRRCAAQSGTSHFGRRSGIELASFRMAGPRFAMAAQPTAPGGSQAMAARLELTKQRLEQIPVQYQSAATWLLPFLVKRTEGVSPRLLALLAGAAKPHLEGARANLQAIAVDEAAFERDLEATVPKSAAAKKGPTS